MKDAIKNLRKKAGLTQIEVSEKLNVKQSTVSMWETGESNPRVELLPKLAEILNCSIDELFAVSK